MNFQDSTLRARNTGARIVIVAMCALAILFTSSAAQNEWYEAGVIIDYGDDRITWIWIPFDEPETPLIDLLITTDLEMVTVGFGGLGEGVCQIDDTGCPISDCRQRMCQTASSSPFWRIMKLSGGEWAFASSGVSGSRIVDGDIYALSWSGNDPELPIVTIDELAQNAGADREASERVSSLRTEGESVQPLTSPAAWVPAISALGLIVMVAGVLVLRARTSRGKPS